MTDSQLFTQAEIARKYNVTKQAVSKAVKKGNIPTIEGKIERNAARVYFDREEGTLREGATTPKTKDHNPIPQPTPSTHVAESRETANARASIRFQKELLELEILQGRYILKKEVLEKIYIAFSELKIALENFDRDPILQIMALYPATPDTQKIEFTIREIIVQAIQNRLAELSQKLHAIRDPKNE